MSRQLAVLALIVGLIATAGCATNRVSVPDRLQARNSFEAGAKFLNERRFANALTMLQQAVALDPEVAVYRNALGITYLQLSRPDLALAEFKKSTEIDPGYAEALLNLGTAHAEQQQWAPAVEAYDRAIKSPRLASTDIAYQNLGLALFHLRRYPEAEQALRFAINLDPGMASAYYHLGLVLAAGDRKEEARQAFERTRDLAPNTPFGQAAADRLKSLGGGG